MPYIQLQGIWYVDISHKFLTNSVKTWHIYWINTLFYGDSYLNDNNVAKFRPDLPVTKPGIKHS